MQGRLGASEISTLVQADFYIWELSDWLLLSLLTNFCHQKSLLELKLFWNFWIAVKANKALNRFFITEKDVSEATKKSHYQCYLAGQSVMSLCAHDTCACQGGVEHHYRAKSIWVVKVRTTEDLNSSKVTQSLLEPRLQLGLSQKHVNIPISNIITPIKTEMWRVYAIWLNHCWSQDCNWG